MPLVGFILSFTGFLYENGGLARFLNPERFKTLVPLLSGVFFIEYIIQHI
jgi:hypothetical protein